MMEGGKELGNGDTLTQKSRNNEYIFFKRKAK
jgi:hypothetical protein